MNVHIQAGSYFEEATIKEYLSNMSLVLYIIFKEYWEVVLRKVTIK